MTTLNPQLEGKEVYFAVIAEADNYNDGRYVGMLTSPVRIAHYSEELVKYAVAVPVPELSGGTMIDVYPATSQGRILNRDVVFEAVADDDVLAAILEINSTGGIVIP